MKLSQTRFPAAVLAVSLMASQADATPPRHGEGRPDPTPPTSVYNGGGGAEVEVGDTSAAADARAAAASRSSSDATGIGYGGAGGESEATGIGYGGAGGEAESHAEGGNGYGGAGGEAESHAEGGRASQGQGQEQSSANDNSNGVAISEVVNSTFRSLGLNLDPVQLDQAGISLPAIISDNDLAFCQVSDGEKSTRSLWIAGWSDIDMNVEANLDCVEDVIQYRLISLQANMDDKNNERLFQMDMRTLEIAAEALRTGMAEYCPSERVIAGTVAREEHLEFCHEPIENSIHTIWGQRAGYRTTVGGINPPAVPAADTETTDNALSLEQ